MTRRDDNSTFADRARAALLAHACGDRFGAPLEFVKDASVRTRQVRLGHWTDDTHMSLYLGEAILEHGPGPLEPDRFGTLVGNAFVRWSHDPLTPSTAPGGTCLTGAARFERERDWTTSGVRESDGCWAVKRIVPLALVYRGDELIEAARISALLSHAHPIRSPVSRALFWARRSARGRSRGSGSTPCRSAMRSPGLRIACSGSHRDGHIPVAGGDRRSTASTEERECTI